MMKRRLILLVLAVGVCLTSTVLIAQSPAKTVLDDAEFLKAAPKILSKSEITLLNRVRNKKSSAEGNILINQIWKKKMGSCETECRICHNGRKCDWDCYHKYCRKPSNKFEPPDLPVEPVSKIGKKSNNKPVVKEKKVNSDE